MNAKWFLLGGSIVAFSMLAFSFSGMDINALQSQYQYKTVQGQKVIASPDSLFRGSIDESYMSAGQYGQVDNTLKPDQSISGSKIYKEINGYSRGYNSIELFDSRSTRELLKHLNIPDSYTSRLITLEKEYERQQKITLAEYLYDEEGLQQNRRAMIGKDRKLVEKSKALEKFYVEQLIGILGQSVAKKYLKYKYVEDFNMINEENLNLLELPVRMTNNEGDIIKAMP